MDRKIHLKIKIKSLAEEAKIIRHEAKRLSRVIRDRQAAGTAKQVLNEHRTGIVRYEARHSLLAYGLLRGRAYETMEKKCNIAPNWTKITEMARRFGGKEVDVAVWVELAKKYIKDQQ